MLKLSRYSYIDLLVSWLFVYFSSKLLWDTVPLIFELGSLGVFAFFAVQLLFSKPGFNRHTVTLFITFFFFSLYVMLNGLLQDNFSQLARAAYEYVFYMLMVFSMIWLLPKADMRKCVKVFAYWGVLIALLSWYEYFTQSYLIAIPVENYAGFRAMVFTRSFLSHGMILGFFSIACMDIYYREHNPLWFLAGVFCFVSILTTSSRGPLVSCGVAVVFQFMVNSFISQRHSLKRLIACALFSAGVLGVIIVMVGKFETPVESINVFLRRIRSIFNWTGDAGNVGRLELWAQAWGWFKTNVVFGIGPSKTGSWGAGSIGVTESGVLKRLCELGLVGFTIFYFFLACILGKAAFTYFKVSDPVRQRMTLWFTFIVAILINDIIVQSTEEIMISFYFWTAFAGLETAAKAFDCSQLQKKIG